MSVTPESLARILQELANPIDNHLNGKGGPRQIGFLLAAFEFGEPGGALAFLSNATKESLGPAIVELLAKMESSGVIVTLPNREA